jgi:hypothetical protein
MHVVIEFLKELSHNDQKDVLVQYSVFAKVRSDLSKV